MGGVGGVQRREEEENANNAFFLFSPPPPPPKRRRRSSMSSSFGSNFATTSSSSNLSLMKLTPRTGICATALARMRYLSSLFVFFSPRFMPQTRRRFIEKFLLYKNRTSDPTPNTRRAVAKIRALQKAKGKEEKKTKMKTTSTTAATTTNTKNTNKKKKDESALAKVIANKEDSPSNEVIVETIESATFGELRTCFPLVFDGKLTSSNNKEWLKAVFKRKMVTDKTYEFVPRTRYSSKNRLNKKKKTEGEGEEQEQEATNASTENTFSRYPKECAQKTPLTPLEDENREEEELKKEVVFSIEVARLEEQPRGNENVNETIATDANTTANDKHKMRELSSFFTKTFSAVSPLLGTRL